MSDCHENIWKVLHYSPFPLAVHEMRNDSRLKSMSENAIATRLSDVEIKNRLWSARRKGFRFLEWWDRPFTDEHRREQMLKEGRLL